MFGPFERTVALRYLRSRRRESFISVIALFALIGIALGVATLIIVMSVMNGFRHELISKILGINGHASAIIFANAELTFDEVAESFEGLEGVTSVAAMVEGQALMRLSGGNPAVLVRGYRAQDIPEKGLQLIEGNLANFQDKAVLIGRRMQETRGLQVGSVLRLVSPSGPAGPFGGGGPREVDFIVAGIFEVGMSEYDANFVFMPLDMAQAFFGLGRNRVTAVEVMADDPNRISAYRNQLANAVAGQAHIRTWQELNSSLVNALTVERNVMFMILTLIILVAAFNIITGQIMLVKDKGRDIAILRTMGASRGMIQRIFLMTGASIGIFGTLVGFVLGLLIADNIDALKTLLEQATGADVFNDTIYFLSNLPSKVDYEEVTSVVIMAVTLSVLSSLYPAWRAARIDPVEALRYE